MICTIYGIGGINMAKINGKGVVLTAFVAGVASYLSKKENRDKVFKMINEMKSRANFVSDQASPNTQYNSLREIAETAAGTDETKLRENNMIAESGLQTAVIYYNENDQPRV